MANILFVDDEDNVLRAIRRSVIDEEYVSYFAASGVEALKIMEEHEINVIVTDMKMPGMDGLQLLKIIKEKYPDIIKIVLSGFTQLSQVLATVNQAEIFNFIAKPWDMESELKYVINKAIEHYELKKKGIQLQQNLEKRNVSYQNVLKKMEANSGNVNKQMQRIKKINSLLLDSLENKDEDESKFLAQLAVDYIDNLPSTMEQSSLSSIVEELRVLVTPYSQVDVLVKNDAVGNIQGSGKLISLAIQSLLNLLQPVDELDGLSIYIGTKNHEGKIIFNFSLFFIDSAGVYEHKLQKCSHKFALKVFNDIMDCKFITLRKNDRQAVQLEFMLDVK